MFAMLAKLLRRRPAARVAPAGGRRRAPFRLWADTRGGVSYIEYIIIIGFVGLGAIVGFKRLSAMTWNTVRAQGITFREIGGAGDIAPVTLAKANVPKMPAASIGPSSDGRIHLPVIQPKCFVAGTPVATEAGLRPIESIAVGERVWARNEHTGEDALARVVQRFVTPDSHVIGVDIPIDVARHEVLRVTENHRFYVPDRGWVPARELDGSRLVSIVPRGPPLASAGASAIESWGERTTVYNIEVEGLHTYFVGEARVLVHNANEEGKDCTDAAKGLAAQIAWKGFSKGELAVHFQKHGAEFGNITQSQYLNQAKSFASEAGQFQEQKVGNFIVKYDPATRRTFIGHASSREIRTFYIADGRSADPFQDAVNLARQLSGL
jgi:hypothetical protein